MSGIWEKKSETLGRAIPISMAGTHFSRKLPNWLHILAIFLALSACFLHTIHHRCLDSSNRQRERPANLCSVVQEKPETQRQESLEKIYAPQRTNHLKTLEETKRQAYHAVQRTRLALNSKKDSMRRTVFELYGKVVDNGHPQSGISNGRTNVFHYGTSWATAEVPSLTIFKAIQADYISLGKPLATAFSRNISVNLAYWQRQLYEYAWAILIFFVVSILSLFFHVTRRRSDIDLARSKERAELPP